jgi:hypothetical protein
VRTGRFINCLDKNNILQYLGTQDYHTLLNKKNMEDVWNRTTSGESIFKDDLAITHTIIKPDFDGSRTIYANDTIILKFEPQELLGFLNQDEKAILMDRINQTYSLLSKMQVYQSKNGFEQKNPLSPVNL